MLPQFRLADPQRPVARETERYQGAVPANGPCYHRTPGRLPSSPGAPTPLTRNSQPHSPENKRKCFRGPPLPSPLLLSLERGKPKLPLRSYFSKRDDRILKMPRADEGRSDANKLACHGDVLTGKLSVQEIF